MPKCRDLPRIQKTLIAGRESVTSDTVIVESQPDSPEQRANELLETKSSFMADGEKRREVKLRLNILQNSDTVSQIIKNSKPISGVTMVRTE